MDRPKSTGRNLSFRRPAGRQSILPDSSFRSGGQPAHPGRGSPTLYSASCRPSDRVAAAAKQGCDVASGIPVS